MDDARAELEARIGARLDQGDSAGAATVAIRGYGPDVLGYLIATLRNRDDAAEVFAHFSENVWRGLPEFRRECSFRTWAYQVAWHAALRFLRDPYRKRGRRLATTEVSKIADDVVSASSARTASARERGVAELRSSLDAAEQTLLVLRVDRELPWSEIAAIMDAPEAALRKRFERLKAKLKEQAKKKGLLER